MRRAPLRRTLAVTALSAALLWAGCNDIGTELLIYGPKGVTATSATLVMEFVGPSAKTQATFLYRPYVDDVGGCPRPEDATDSGATYNVSGWSTIAPDPASAAANEARYGEAAVTGLTPGTPYIVCVVGMVGDLPQLGRTSNDDYESVVFRTLALPTATPSATSSPTATATVTPTATATATASPSPTPAATPASTPAPAPPVDTPTPAATAAPTPTPEPSASPTPTATPAATPAATATPQPVEDEPQTEDSWSM